MLPSTPQIFHGRDSEFEEILKLFRQGTPRIAILGMGGMGKTSLAQAVLHHTEVTIKYTGNSFFVPCDKASNKIELAGHIGAHLGLKTSPDMTQEVLLHLSSNESPTLLVLDNLETVWEPVESRNAVEDFLSKLTDLPGLALMITMRGAERPAKVQWTRPFPLPLSPLNQDAARMLFIDIADDHHSVEEVDKILSLTNNMPLAITLLAHLVDAEDCTEILSRWEKEKTSLISDGYDKRSNLELSISLSLASPRITSMTGAQDLLSLLSMLPDGLSDAELKCSNFPIKNILGCKTALLRTALAYSDDHKRLKALVPIREYMATAFPPTEQMIRPLRKHFQELLELFTTESGKQSSALLVDRLTSNLTNIQNLLHNSLELGNPDLTGSIYSVCHMNILWRYIGRGAIPLLHQIHTFLKTSENHHLITFVITETIKTTQYHLVSEFEALIAQALEHVNHINDIELEGKIAAISFFYWY
ncbi:P-loop containing nucleoside triphosphate hydrolase protein [Mycena filopes]|nr:P-loop containing nucleoside triphosphate hydrolase protein [Mycena filopes]